MPHRFSRIAENAMLWVMLALGVSACAALTDALNPPGVSRSAPQQDTVVPSFAPDLSQRTPGLDVSHFQGTQISWTELKSDGLEFVMIKASQGVSSPDPEFRAHVAGADSVGLPTGAYHFFQPGDPPRAQAAFFLKTIAGQSLELPPVLDLEGALRPGDLKAALDWLGYVKAQTGCQPVLYIDEANYRLIAPLLEDDQPVWLAAYSRTLPASGLPPALWFWQHTSQAEYSGAAGDVDSDWFFGTPQQLTQLGCSGSGTAE